MSQVSFPASFAQQRLWFLDQLESGTAAYNLARAFRITGPLDVPALTRAFRVVVARHESLRTIFESVDGQPTQIVLTDVAVESPVVDLTGIPEQQREQEALRLASEEGRKPFDLTCGPLLRTLLIRLNSNQHLLVMVLHHIITDGWSIAILFRELTKCYEAFIRGEKPDLPELPVQYAEYAQWQREYITGEVLQEQVEYWKSQLSGAPTVIELPADHPRPAIHSWHGATEELVFDKAILARLKAMAQAEGATLFMASMAAFQALLWRYTMQDSILVGTPVAGRKEVEIENLIGFFVNTLVFRADFSDGLSYRELVRQIRAFALNAYAHQDVPFEKLVEQLVPQRSMDTTPLFQVMFTFQNIPKQIFQISGLDMEELMFDTGIAKFYLSADAYEDNGLHFRFEYNTDLFDQSTIKRMIGHFARLVPGVLERPDQPLAQLALMTPEEEEEIALTLNPSPSEYPRESTIAKLFEKQARRTPDSTALLSQGRRFSYREINQQANRLARHLIESGARPGDLVGLALERSTEMIVALLAILKAGAAYVPLDPNYPAERLALMIEDAGVWGVVTLQEFTHNLGQVKLIALDRDGEAIQSQSSTNPSVPISGDDRAYVIYTSGSTGKPKGVEATHRASINRFAWMWEKYPFRAGEICCQKTNLGFVDSIWEIFGPLLAGVPNLIVPQEALRDPEELLGLLASQGVTRIVLVPSLLRSLLEAAPDLGQRVPRLELWSSSGEVLSVELAKRFRIAHPKAKLLNIYGSSEVGADVTCYEVGDLDGRASVPIGHPISNTEIYIFDRHQSVVPRGVRGEIYVGGDGLARGYWKRPELTSERFVENRLPGGSRRLFRTGDLGRWRGDGLLEYLGRLDSQVKLRGMRLELGEVEAALASHAAVQAAAVGVSGEGDQQRLVAYLVAAEGQMPALADLRRYLRNKLPEHMVPATYVLLESLPLLPSGKVNRKALGEARGKRLTDDSTKLRPRSEVEKKLAEMWQELLKVDDVGVEQNFFEMGGHSLLVLRSWRAFARPS
ncbi:MAG: amino acid adenylation domain-containing protein, partial [Acidobacteria bacterium]|nr:amino acid adenylation domain-containing protein [Acidobacteriota bacterium]